MHHNKNISAGNTECAMHSELSKVPCRHGVGLFCQSFVPTRCILPKFCADTAYSAKVLCQHGVSAKVPEIINDIMKEMGDCTKNKTYQTKYRPNKEIIKKHSFEKG